MHRCDCCDGTDIVTPLPIQNRPGRDSIAFRVGTYSSFFESSVASLNVTRVAALVGNEAIDVFPLREKLKTRRLNDPTIALLDAWATIADVLTFYQERIANEGFLGTARQQRSLHELSSVIGYNPRPGVSSSVLLAFEVEKPEVSSEGVTADRFIPNGGVLIPVGTAVESTPSTGSDEESQTFETSADLIAFEQWNAIPLRTTQPQCINKNNVYALDCLYFKGVGLGLKINDIIYVDIPGLATPAQYVIQKVEEFPEPQLTKVLFTLTALSTSAFLERLNGIFWNFATSILLQPAPYLTQQPPALAVTIQEKLGDILRESYEPALGLMDLDSKLSSQARTLEQDQVASNKVLDNARQLRENLSPNRLLEHNQVIVSLRQGLNDSLFRYLKDDELKSFFLSNLDETSRAHVLAKALLAIERENPGGNALSLEFANDEVSIGVNTEVAVDDQAIAMAARDYPDLIIQGTVLVGAADAILTFPPNSIWNITSPANNAKTAKSLASVRPDQIQEFLRAIKLRCPTAGFHQLEIRIESAGVCVAIVSKRFLVGPPDTARLTAKKNCSVCLGSNQQLLGSFDLIPAGVGPFAVDLKLQSLDAADNLSDRSFGAMTSDILVRQLSAVRFSCDASKPGNRWVTINIKDSAGLRSVVYRRIIVLPSGAISATQPPKARVCLGHFAALYNDAGQLALTELRQRIRTIRLQMNDNSVSSAIMDFQSLSNSTATLASLANLSDTLQKHCDSAPSTQLVNMRLAEDLLPDLKRADLNAKTQLDAKFNQARTWLQSFIAGLNDGYYKEIVDLCSTLVTQYGQQNRTLKQSTDWLDKLQLSQFRAATELENRLLSLSLRLTTLIDSLLNLLRETRLKVLSNLERIADKYATDRSNAVLVFVRSLMERLKQATVWSTLQPDFLLRSIADSVSQRLIGAPFECRQEYSANALPHDSVRLLQSLRLLCPSRGPSVLRSSAALDQLLSSIQTIPDITQPDVATDVISRNQSLLAAAVPSLAMRNTTARDTSGEQLRTFRIDSPLLKPRVFLFRTQSNLFGWNAPPKNLTLSDEDVKPLVQEVQNAIVLFPNNVRYWFFNNHLRKLKDELGKVITKFFHRLLPRLQISGPAPEAPDTLYLDGEIREIRDRDFLGIRLIESALPTLYRVKQSKVFPRSAYRLRGVTTQVKLQSPWWDARRNKDFPIIQNTRVFCETTDLELAEEPLPTDAAGERLTDCDSCVMPSTAVVASNVVLDSVVEGLVVGQKVFVQGQVLVNGEATKDMRAELVTIIGIRHEIRDCLFGDRFVTRLYFDSLQNNYMRSSVRIRANLVEATHGKTQVEPISDGNGSMAFQKQQLTVPYVSQVPVPSASGTRDELNVFVDNVRWLNSPNFRGASVNDRLYVAKRSFTQRMTVVFGDGQSGARPPSGRSNVVSRYRTGLGIRGNVPSGRIDQVSGSSIGVKSVINPLAAVGGADPDDQSQIRTRAPLAVSSFDRLVSLSDFQNFALNYAGIGKAQAILDANQKVTLTIAASHPGPTPADSKLMQNLKQSLRNFGDEVAIDVLDRTVCYLVIYAKIEIDLLHQWANVEETVRKRLLSKFSYRESQFDQTLYASDVYRTIQQVSGVNYVQLVEFDHVDLDDSRLTTAGSIFDRKDSFDFKGHLPAKLCFLTPDVKACLRLEMIKS